MITKYIDLHLHLDGSISLENAKKLCGINHFEIPSDEELKSKLYAPKNCSCLNDYLKAFDFPLSLLQTKESIYASIINLCEELRKKGYIYAEIRFCPSLHTNKGLTEDEVSEIALKAREKTAIPINYIFCLMRNFNYSQNEKVIMAAKKYFKKGVVALDLAGAEGVYKTSLFKKEFALVKKLGIPFTIHAGEDDGPESVKDALDFGASRIGHGVRIIEDKKIMNRIKENDILIELCPTSERDTKAVPSYDKVPVREFIQNKILFSICSDDMSVSNIDVPEEIKRVQKTFGLTDEEIVKTIKDGIKYSFASGKLKKTLLAKIN